MLIILLTVLLLVGSIVVAAGKAGHAKRVALVFASAGLVISLIMLFQFRSGAEAQFVTSIPWVPSLNIHFHLAADGISLLLVLLTTTLTPLIIYSSFNKQIARANVFYSLILFMQMALVGVFTAMDGFLFYVFWELALIPIYFICLLWGGDGRARITFKFFLYTMVGSLFMLAALIILYLHTPNQSFAIDQLYQAHNTLSPTLQHGVFWGLFLAFAVKMPIFPFHTWQPDTYTNAPTQGSMLLSAIMLKMGVYGMIRWLLPTVPFGMDAYAGFAAILAVIGIVYASCIALAQVDFKRLIAYSSLAHVGLMAAGVLSQTEHGVIGAVMQMLSHGIVVFALFFAADVFINRTGSSALNALGGIRTSAPLFATSFLIVILGSIALPLTSGFPGEFLLLSGIFQFNIILAVFAGLTVILGAVYMLRAYQKACLGERRVGAGEFRDITGVEKTVFVIVAVCILALGIFPKPILDLAGPSVRRLLEISSQ